MKLLCLSDEEDRLVYSQSAKERYRDVDCIISAGDLPFSYYDYVMTTLNKDFYYVYGNHNLEHFNELMGIQEKAFGQEEPRDCYGSFGGNFVDGKVVYDKRHHLIIAGLGGSMLYNGGKSQYSEKAMASRIRKMTPILMYNKARYGRYLDILITHAPPKGIGDGPDLCHQGFACFLTFMDRFKPKYLLNGHMHLIDQNQNRVNLYGDTKVINVFQSYIIDDDSLGEGSR